MTTHLTDTQKTQIRIALATHEGLIEPGFNAYLDCLPNYPADLNACHAIEVKLTDEEHSRFRKNLEDLTWVELRPSETCRNYISSSAEHRSLALFRALNLGELGD